MEAINFEIPREEVVEDRIINFNMETIFTLVVSKNMENPKNLQPEEIISELFFKYYSLLV